MGFPYPPLEGVGERFPSTSFLNNLLCHSMQNFKNNGIIKNKIPLFIFLNVKILF